MRIGDTGTVIELTITDGRAPLNLTNWSVLEIELRRAGVRLVKQATIVGTATSGRIRYVLDGSEFTAKPGKWTVRAHVTIPSGSWRSTDHEFDVEA